MKRKEIKNLAKKIAKAEYIIQTSDDEVAIARAKQEIFLLCGSAEALENMDEIDELVQDIMAKMS